MSGEVKPPSNGFMQSDCPTRRPCMFYKLMVESILHDKQLEIPRKFVKRYGNELQDLVELTTSSSNVRLVGLRKANHRVWFCYGWQNFVEDHSIHVGCFLVFTYEGNSKFHIDMFSLMGLQTSGRIYNVVGLTTNATITQPSESLDNSLSRNMQDKGIQVNLSCGTSRCLKRRLTTESFKEGGNKIHRTKVSSDNSSMKGRPITKEEREKVINEARLFKPDGVSFMLIMRPSHVYSHFLVHLPCWFVRKHLREGDEDIKLQISNGKNWLVKCIFYSDSQAKMSKGWRVFALENGLEEGDVCVFELVGTKNVVLKVLIFRAHQPNNINLQLK